MKKARLLKILELIEEYEIETQEAMLDYLNDFGIKVTQATVSRDISELKLTKALGKNGKYKYIVPQNNDDKIHKLNSIFISSVLKVDYAGNTVVIKCEVGMAMAACASFDAMNYPDVVGTLAGDDTIFVLMRTENNAGEMCKNLLKQLSK